jgi:uncharacterized damage-inducible protein DinB
MQIAELLLPEFDQEMASTRKVLERVPNDKLDWKAHPKSCTIGWVASHLVEIPNWVEGTCNGDSWDVHPPGQAEMYHTPVMKSREEMLAAFDQHVTAARAAIEKTSDEAFWQPWSLLMQGKPLFTMPRYTVIRSFVINHIVHHRAFLLSYLRLNDIPIPGMYGPSADEQS